MPQAIEFWPLKSLFEVLEVHRDSISQSGSCLRSVRVHSLTLSYTPESMWCDSRASSWPTSLQPLCFDHKPKARVATINLEMDCKLERRGGQWWKTILPRWLVCTCGGEYLTSNNALQHYYFLIFVLVLSRIKMFNVIFKEFLRWSNYLNLPFK